MIVFISGKMTGLPDYNREAFERAEEILSGMGHTVLNPANHTPLFNPEAIPHAGYISICKAMIDQCDTIYQLRGWEDSPGAKLEFQYAIHHGKQILQQGGE